MKPRVAQSLRDALDFIQNINWIVSQRAGYDYRRYQREPVIRWALERQFGNLGRALERGCDSDPWLRHEVPEIGQMIAFQTNISKKYDQVDDEVVWSTAINDMDDLRRSIQNILQDAGELRK